MSAVTTILSNPISVGLWDLDSDRSSIGFQNGTMWGALKVRGTFTEFSGGGEITEARTVSGRIDIKSGSINTGLGKRDEDLRRANFFDSEHYPNISVVVKSGEPAGADYVKLDAELTVKGITGPLPLKAKVTPLDHGAVRLSAEAIVTRKQFAVEGNFLGMVGNRTKLHVELVFRPVKT